jgi:hypothetical protein
LGHRQRNYYNTCVTYLPRDRNCAKQRRYLQHSNSINVYVGDDHITSFNRTTATTKKKIMKAQLQATTGGDKQKSLTQKHSWKKGLVFLICAIAFFNILRMNKLKSIFGGGINLIYEYEYEYEYEYQNQNQTSQQNRTVDENSTTKDDIMIRPIRRNNQTTGTGTSTSTSTGVSDENLISTIVDDDIPEQMRLTMLDLTPDDIQVISQLNDDHLDQWGKIPDNHRNCHSPKLNQPKGLNEYDVTSRCCIGSISVGGYQYYAGHHNKTCIQNITAYEKVRDYTIDELNSIPISNDGNTQSSSSSSSSSSLMQCDICRIIQIVSTLKHRRISIVGDSIQRQLFNGMECELLRRGFNISEWKIEKWEDEPRPNYTGWKFGIKDQSCFTISVPDWLSKNNNNNNNKSIVHDVEVEVCNFNHYRPYPDMIQHKKIVNISDIMVIDYGLHYLPDEPGGYTEYFDTLIGLMELGKDAPNCHLIYRESSAQHFDRPGGGFSWYDRPKSKQCIPHYGNHSEYDVRNNIIFNAARSQNYSIVSPDGNSLLSSSSRRKVVVGELNFLPFWNFTSKLSFLHASNDDCSHFCYTPDLWITTWRNLRNTLDRLMMK